MGPPPIVTGISPKEGPPGTRVIIRGEYLGNGPNDIISVIICDSDCTLSAEWKSTNKIIARSGPGKGRGDIIVTTKSGGLGTNTVQFRGYHETIGPLKESAVWVEEAPLQSLTWAHRSMSTSTYHLEDPLGLSVEDNEKKFPEDDLHELFPNSSGDLAAENFDPNCFLLQNHLATSFADLKVGLSYLKRKVEGQKEGQLSFLKDNVSSVMEQMDTLFLLKDKFEEDMKKPQGDYVGKIQKAIKDSISESTKLFDEVLSRKEKADATRNALAVVTRHKFLFFLPANIERGIKCGDFDLVVSDYQRAKNLFGKFETPIFHQILSEVDGQIQNVKILLLNKLENFPATLDQQKRIIRNLTTLGFEGDPGWLAIENTFEYARCHAKEMLEKFVSEECNAANGENNKSNKSSGAVPFVKKHFRNLSGGQMLSDAAAKIKSPNAPNRILFLEYAAEFLVKILGDARKLSQAYFNGDLLAKPDKNAQKKYKSEVVSLVELYCDMLKGAVLPPQTGVSAREAQSKMDWPQSQRASALHEMLSIWLPHCIRHVKGMYASLLIADVPVEALELARKFLFNLRVKCMNSQLKRMADQANALGKKETWEMDYDAEHGAITHLPNEFEKMIRESMQIVKESAFSVERKEIPILEDTAIAKDFNVLICKAFLNFVRALEVLGMISEDHDHSVAMSQLIGSPMPCMEKNNTELEWEQRLLVMLSNCRYSRLAVFPRLQRAFQSHGFPDIGEAVERSGEAFVHLEKRMVEAYVEQKSDPLVGTIEPSMYLGRFDWDKCPEPKDVLPYAKEILTNVTAVHAEVHRCVPSSLPLVISEIVETVAEELSRLMACVTKFNIYGNQQARIDILALREIFEKYLTPNASAHFNEALAVLPELSARDLRITENILNSFQQKMKLQLSCFQ